MRILLTGASGFIGSNICNFLCRKGYELLLTKRASSDLSLINELSYNIIQIDWSKEGWIEKAIDFKPDVIIHSAWIGINSYERDNDTLQAANLILIDKLINIAVASQTKKFIGLGSQAEYGNIECEASEEDPVFPFDSYGKTKLQVLHHLQSASLKYDFEYYWLRIFSVFGDGQSKEWLIPSVINNILFSPQRFMDFTLGEQIYSYLDVEDISYSIELILQSTDKSGVYNISSSDKIKLKELIISIRDLIDSSFKLNFGAIPYRLYQIGRASCRERVYVLV